MSITKTRSGRQIKKPELFKPTEDVVLDDYAEDDHDSDLGSEIDTEDEYDSQDDSEFEDDDEEADENGNLKDFVVDESDESDEEI
jgi:hypothetical protein